MRLKIFILASSLQRAIAAETAYLAKQIPARAYRGHTLSQIINEHVNSRDIQRRRGSRGAARLYTNLFGDPRERVGRFHIALHVVPSAARCFSGGRYRAARFAEDYMNLDAGVAWL
jgi:hypothetical protein